MKLTRREKIFLTVAVGFLVLIFIFPAIAAPEYEMFYILFIVLPLGWLIATDPERIQP